MALPTRRVSQERNHPKINFDGSIMTIDRIKAVLHVLFFADETPKIRVIGTSVIRITSKVGNFCESTRYWMQEFILTCVGLVR